MAEHYEVILRSIGAITGNLAFNLDIKIHHLLLAFFIFIFPAILTAVIAMKNRKLRKFLSGDQYKMERY